jgi:hypothetical protein
MSEDNVVDFMQRLKEKAEQTKRAQDQAVAEKMDDDMRRIVADAVMAMRNLGATDEQIAFRLEVAASVTMDDPDAEFEFEEILRTQEPFSFD